MRERADQINKLSGVSCINDIRDSFFIVINIHTKNTEKKGGDGGKEFEGDGLNLTSKEVMSGRNRKLNLFPNEPGSILKN